jgi:integrase
MLAKNVLCCRRVQPTERGVYGTEFKEGIDAEGQKPEAEERQREAGQSRQGRNSERAADVPGGAAANAGGAAEHAERATAKDSVGAAEHRDDSTARLGNSEQAPRKSGHSTIAMELRRMADRGRLARAPKLSFFRPDNRRTGFFEQAEHEAVRAGLKEPFADIAHFAFLSGWRRDEIEGLRWDRIDRKACLVWLWDSKNGSRRTLPYGSHQELSELVERRWQARQYPGAEGPALSALVFHVEGRPVGDWRKRWQRSCVAAGVGRYIRDQKGRIRGYVGKFFHDYRRTTVRDLIRAGVDRSTAKLISGHRSDSVFERYGIMTEREKAQGLAKLEKFRRSGEEITTDLLRKPVSGDFKIS